MKLIEFKQEWDTAINVAAARIAPVRLSSRVPIVIAEDDAVSRLLLVSILRAAGYDPVVTANGSDAMSALRLQDRPCVAIVDWMMPEMDGAEVCRRVRAGGRAVHVIMLTARDRKEDAVEALDAGADDYLIKPFDRDELLARVRAGIRTLDAHGALTRRAQELELAVLAASSGLEIPL